MKLGGGQSNSDYSAELQSMTVSELKELARELGVSGSVSLRKSDLIKKILNSNGKNVDKSDSHRTDWLEVQEAGLYWLGLTWNVTDKLQKRAASSLGREWHRAEKVLRVYRVDWDDSGPQAREHYRDEPLPQDAKNWFIQIDGRSSGWKVELGYLAPGGKFFSLLHSANLHVDTSPQRQLTSQATTANQESLAVRSDLGKSLSLNIEGDITIKGKTTPGAATTIDDVAVNVHEKTGMFHWRAPIQNGRVVIPIVTENGSQRIRAIFSMESNVHYLDPEKTNLDS